MVTSTDVLQRIRQAGDVHALLRVSLEAALAATQSERGFVALVDSGTGRLFGAVSSGVPEADLYGLHAMLIGGRREHPLLSIVRDGVFGRLRARDLEGTALAPIRRLGVNGALCVALPTETVVSPCLQAGRCLSRRCPVRERTASASPDEEWQHRVSSACVRGAGLRSCGFMFLEASPDLDGSVRDDLEDIVHSAARELRRFGQLALRAPHAPTVEAEEEWARRAFGAVEDPVLVADSQGDIRFSNAQAGRLFFASSSDSEGRRRAVDLNRMLLSAWMASYLGASSRDRPRELSLVDPEEGSELLFELLTSTARNAVTRDTGTVVVLKDVSDIRHAVDELTSTLRKVDSAANEARRERDQLNLILESIGQLVVVTDPQANILRMNHAARRLLEAPAGAPERELDIVKRNDAIVTSFLSQAAISGTSASTEVAITDPRSGETRSYAANAAVARDALGAPAAVVSVFADLTVLRELERRRLERQLFESEKLAATGRLAASFAHEINNPLEAMKNALYLLAANLRPDHPERRFVEIARGETDRISRIVRQILGFFRPSMVRVEADLNALISEAVELLGPQMRQARVRCTLALDRTLPRIIASPDQLKQLFLNLLLNGIQAMPGGGELTVSTSLGGAERHPQDRTYVGAEAVVVEVSDTGQGIPPDVQPRLFEPFFTTKESSGLGLWVCHEIAEAHGGTITVSSQQGTGSTFRVVLPVAPPQTPEASPHAGDAR